MIIRERLYLTVDRKRVVNENEREGRFLFAKPGDDIPDSIAKQYGLIEEKMVKQPENKMVESVPNKKARKTSGLTINKLPDNENEGE